jgi:hypothetical protein
MMENEQTTQTEEEVVLKAVDAQQLDLPVVQTDGGTVRSVSPLLNAQPDIKPLARHTTWAVITIKTAIFLSMLELPGFWLMDYRAENKSMYPVLLIGVAMWIASLGSMVASVAVMAFMYRAQKNLVSGGVPGLRFSATWAWVGWLIPVVNWIQPCSVLGETWKASNWDVPEAGIEWKKQRLPRMFYTWWICWLAAAPAAQIGAILVSMIHLPMVAYGAIMSIRTVLTVVASLALIKIIKDVNHRQMHKFPQLRQKR